MFLQSAADLLYPSVCLLCQRRVPSRAHPFCEACEGGMPACQAPVCQRCGVGLPGAYDAQPLCQRCRKRPLAFERARAPLVYVGGVREAVHAFKYHGRHRIGTWLAERMAHLAVRELPVTDITTVTPVPLHAFKRRLKGTDPSAFLAHAVATRLNLPCDRRCLRRARWTSTQTRLSLRQRFHNVDGAFTAPPARIAQQVLLLVDDVLTSGATAHACTLAMREAGASMVFVLTAARAPREDG